VPGPIHALFHRRYGGDDALLRLAALRFAQLGLAAELYAATAEELEGVLPFAPTAPSLPTVHLHRDINLLHEQGRDVVGALADRFAGRIGGMVVHDQRDMGEQTDLLVSVLREFDARLGEDRPFVFLEYAAWLEPAWFVEVAERLRDASRVSVCIDIGHIGIRQASARFAAGHPGLRLQDLGPRDGRLPEVVADVQDAMAGALRDVIEVIEAVARLGKHVHFHLHDGHPLIWGLSDHFTFLRRLPIPFEYQGRRSLDMLYGPGGLASIVSAACSAASVSFTLEVHQVEGRLPLDDAAGLFSGWPDTTNAERMNYWLSVLGENAILLSEGLASQSSSLASRSSAVDDS
jgi:hypothetical protein